MCYLCRYWISISVEMAGADCALKKKPDQSFIRGTIYMNKIAARLRDGEDAKSTTQHL